METLKAAGYGDTIREKTGLVPDAYFSGTKLKWILDELNLRERARRGELCFGTVDSFLAWHLTEGNPHVTDATNAARTMLFNLHTQQWDDELLQMLDIPRAMLPRVVDTAQVIGVLRGDIIGARVPVAALAGDQHAALFGQGCFEEGMVKNTYGTGCFMLMNAGERFRLSHHGLITTLAWRLNGLPVFAFEGSVFMGGASIQWLRDELKLISTAAESEAVAASVPDTGGVYLVPAFTGLGAPYWSMYARGTLVGMTRGAGRAQIVRAALEAIAYQSHDLLAAMAEDCGKRPRPAGGRRSQRRPAADAISERSDGRAGAAAPRAGNHRPGRGHAGRAGRGAVFLPGRNGGGLAPGGAIYPRYGFPPAGTAAARLAAGGGLRPRLGPEPGK